MKYILSIILLLASLGIVRADDLSIGYCDGDVVDASLSQTSASAVAIKLNADAFSMYCHSKITGARIGLTSDAPGGIVVFVRSSLDGRNLYEMKTGALFKGWNDISFTTPVDYPQGDIVVGTTSSGYVGISGDAWTNGCWVLNGGKWTDMSASEGQSLCLQALIDGDSYHTVDAALLSLSSATVSKGKAFSLSGKLRNNTSQDATTAKIAYRIGDKEATCDVSLDDILPGEIGSFTLPVEAPDTIGNYTLEATLQSINGQDDEFAANNTATTSIKVLGEVVPKKVLIEEFTTQGCSNCPAGQTRIAEGVKGLDNYVLVAHHYGAGTDIFTASGSSVLQRFYNSSTTFAPAMMIDRTNMTELGVSTSGPVLNVLESDQIRKMVNHFASSTASVSVGIKRDYDEASRQLKIQAGSHVVEGSVITGTPALHVLLIEDGVIAEQSPDLANYQHNHICRRFVTPVNGEPITFVGGAEIEKTYTVTLPADWDASNMHIVAFVSNYDLNDCNNCQVYNVEQVDLVGHDAIETGIATTQTNAVGVPTAIYDVQGSLRNHLSRGINIVRYSNGEVRKVMAR